MDNITIAEIITIKFCLCDTFGFIALIFIEWAQY